MEDGDLPFQVGVHKVSSAFLSFFRLKWSPPFADLYFFQERRCSYGLSFIKPDITWAPWIRTIYAGMSGASRIKHHIAHIRPSITISISFDQYLFVDVCFQIQRSPTNSPVGYAAKVSSYVK